MSEAEEREELIAQRRAKAFMNDGCSKDDAYELACLMGLRDREQGCDDRRVCFECKHYKAKKCEAIRDKYDKPTQQTRFMLMRCDHFKLKGTK
jgi:hypothetical protein